MNPQVASLPFAADEAKSEVQRYRRLFATLAGHAETVAAASDVGALTHEEALAAIRRHAGDLIVAIAMLDAREVDRGHR
jgi:hypothetical protein